MAAWRRVRTAVGIDRHIFVSSPTFSAPCIHWLKHLISPPPKLEVSTAILLSFEALCLLTRRWIENIVPKGSENNKLFFRLHIKHGIWEHVWKWQAVVIPSYVGLVFPCVSSVRAFIHSGYIEAVAFNKVTRLENIWIKWHPLPWMDQIDLSW